MTYENERIKKIVENLNTDFKEGNIRDFPGPYSTLYLAVKMDYQLERLNKNLENLVRIFSEDTGVEKRGQ